MRMDGPSGVGSRRRNTYNHYQAEDQALDAVAKQAEARLAARRAARVEAREIRMRELERQQKDAEDDDTITPANSSRASSVSVRVAATPQVRAPTGSYASSRRSSEDSTEEGGFRDTRSELRELEEKFRKAMISNAQLDNEKSALAYQVDCLKDQLEDLEEIYNDQQRQLKSKGSELEQVKRVLSRLKEDNSVLQAQLLERDSLIQEHGLVVVGTEEAQKVLVSAKSAQLLQEAGEGSLDIRLKKFAEEKNELLDEIRRLKLDLDEQRNKNTSITSNTLPNGPEMELLDVQREANRLISDYKFKLQKSEQEAMTLQGNVARLESQVVRYKSAAESAEKAEDELKVEKRKLQRELREAQARVEELETANSHLSKRLDKVKNARSMLLKEL